MEKEKECGLEGCPYSKNERENPSVSPFAKGRMERRKKDNTGLS
jgi:hypothetical protein